MYEALVPFQLQDVESYNSLNSGLLCCFISPAAAVQVHIGLLVVVCNSSNLSCACWLCNAESICMCCKLFISLFLMIKNRFLIAVVPGCSLQTCLSKCCQLSVQIQHV
jgi:hypothetical protein